MSTNSKTMKVWQLQGFGMENLNLIETEILTPMFYFVMFCDSYFPMQKLAKILPSNSSLVT